MAAEAKQTPMGNQASQTEMANALGKGLESTLVPLVRRFDDQLGLVSDSQDGLLKRLDSITEGTSCAVVRHISAPPGMQPLELAGV